MRLEYKILSTLATLAVLTGCNFDDNSLPGSPTTQTEFAAICELSDISGPVVCEDYVTIPTSQTDCTSTEKNNYATEGAIGATYLLPQGSNTFISCATNITNAIVGSCQLSDRVLRYYTGPWTTPTAQSDCTNRSGQWL